MSDAIAQIVEQVGNVVAVEFGQPRAVNPSTPWEEARPLDDEFGPAVPYPVDCLPAVLRKAVEHYQAFGQQPMSLVASSALSAVSVACQGLADVGRDQNLIGPCSLNFELWSILVYEVMRRLCPRHLEWARRCET